MRASDPEQVFGKIALYVKHAEELGKTISIVECHVITMWKPDKSDEKKT